MVKKSSQRTMIWLGAALLLLLLAIAPTAATQGPGGQGIGQGPPEHLREQARPVFEIEGVVYTDATESGLLEIGVVNQGLAGAVEQRLQQLNIPLSSVEIVETQPIVFATSLQEYQRPIEGGLQISFVDGGLAYACTLGFNAVRDGDGEDGFVVNSHCTSDQFADDGTSHYQPQLGSSEYLIGSEIDDPSAFRCARGRQCRYSDAAFDRRAAGVEAALGAIARTDGVNSGSLTIDGSFSVVAEHEGNATVGTILNKVGRTTGWTQGEVTSSCVDTGVSGSNILLLCQDFVAAGVGGGDSGSPVFKIDEANPDNATLYGILWGGASDGTYFVYSPLDNVESELGTLTTFNAGSIDNTPSVTITNPTDGAIVSGSITVSADASDDDAVTQVEFFDDGSSIGRDIEGGDGWSVSWDTTSATEGENLLSATASDTAGQTATDTISVLVDNKNDPPVADAGPDQTVIDSDGDGTETVTLDASAGEPIAFDAASSAHTDPDADTLSWEHTTSGSDRIMLVGVTTRSNTAVSSLTYAGTSLTKIRHDNPGSDVRTELWYLIAPPEGTGLVELTAEAATTIEAGATTWTGVGQTVEEALGANVGAFGLSTTAAVDIASAEGQVVVDVVGTQNANATVTAGAGQTERWNVIGTAGVGAASSEPGAATVTMSWDLAVEESWAISAVALLPSGGSYDPDGTIESFEWDTDGDGTTDLVGEIVDATFAIGSHEVTLTVTDDDGATATDAATITVEESSGTDGITLTATGSKERGLQKADLEWSNATSTKVDIYRDGDIIVSTENDGFHTDNIDQRGSGTYTYQVCEAGTSTCSNEATVDF